MAWWGKAIGGVLGSMAFGPLGTLLGVAIGHSFDRRESKIRRGDGGARETIWSSQERIQTAFFTATFSVLGYIAKVDGYVSPYEIQFAEHVMRGMQLDDEMRDVAVELFREGKSPDFELEPVLTQFNKECGRRKNLKRMFIEILLSAAMCDSDLDKVEKEAIHDIARTLGFSDREYEQLYQTVVGEAHAAAGPDKVALSDDYKVLGLSQNATDAEVKSAYRRKMSQLHPDKLVSQGLPDEMMEFATEKTKQIRAAYERIRDHRKTHSATH